MTNLNNAMKENEYRKEAGLNKDDDKNNKLLYNKIDFLNNINKAVGELPFEIIIYIMENNFYNEK